MTGKVGDDRKLVNVATLEPAASQAISRSEAKSSEYGLTRSTPEFYEERHRPDRPNAMRHLGPHDAKCPWHEQLW